MSKTRDEYSPKETAKRRDEVIRRMANTPPQPNANPSHHQKMEKPTDAGHAARKGRVRREP